MVKNLPCNVRDACSIPHAAKQLRLSAVEPMRHKEEALELQQEIPHDTTKIPFAKIKLKKKKRISGQKPGGLHRNPLFTTSELSNFGQLTKTGFSFFFIFFFVIVVMIFSLL